MLRFLLALVVGSLSPGAGAARGSPIRKVVDLLKAMQRKVEARSEEAKEIIRKQKCFCEKGTADLQAQIQAAQERIPQLKSQIEASKAEQSQVKQALEQSKNDHEQTVNAMQTAAALREKEASVFAAEDAERQSNIQNLNKAIAALKKGIGAGFLQTRAAETVRRLSTSMDMPSLSRDLLSEFIAMPDAHASSSEEIIGILTQLRENMSREAAESAAEETRKVANHESLTQSQEKEIGALNSARERSLTKHGDLAVRLASLKTDLQDSVNSLDQDQRFLAHLVEECKSKEADAVVFQQMQSEEELAIEETIKLLNKDDVHEVYKKQLSGQGASFLQLAGIGGPTGLAKQRRRAALNVLGWRRRPGGGGGPGIGLLELALRGGKAGFEEVIGMIDSLVALHGKERQDDATRLAWCRAEIRKGRNEVELTSRSLSNLEKSLAEKQDEFATCTQALEALSTGIKELDGKVAEATVTRKREHALSVENLAANNAAVQIIELAQNRLSKFYNAVEATFAQQHVRSDRQGRDAPQAMPEELNLSYSEDHEGKNHVVEMLNHLKSDLSKEIVQIGTEEERAQKDYQTYIKDSTDKRALDSKSIADKEADKAGLESELQTLRDKMSSHTAGREDTKKELVGLHADCDFLLENFDARAQAREEEVDSLRKAKAVLSGADST